MTPEGTGRRKELVSAVLLTILILLAFALRAWRLGHWGLEGDEIFTARDSNSPQFSNPRPLLYFLNYYLIRPFMPLDEVGLRLLPALFGVLGIPAFYLVVSRLAGTRAALFGALLLTFNPLHVYQSQYARYWSLVFLLSAVYPFAIYLGLRERNRRALAVGLVTGVLAALAHPVSVLLAGGLGLWLLVSYLRRGNLAQSWRHPRVRWGALLAVILTGLIAVRYVPVLGDWILVRPRLQLGEHLLHLPSGPGVTQIGLLLSFVESLTLPLVLTGVVGIYLLWYGRDRQLALLLSCLLVFPVAFIVILSFRTAVSTTYLLPTAPIFFIGAGVFLDRLAEADWELRPRWLLPATLAAVILAAGAPTLISQYRDGRRYDFRGVAHWLDAHLAPGDLVFSDQYRTMTYYLRGAQVQRLTADPVPLTQSVHLLQAAGRGGALWLVMPYSSQGGHRTNPRLGSLKQWIYDNCQLRHAMGAARLDFRQNELQVFRCPPEVPDEGTRLGSAAIHLFRYSGAVPRLPASQAPPR